MAALLGCAEKKGTAIKGLFYLINRWTVCTARSLSHQKSLIIIVSNCWHPNSCALTAQKLKIKLRRKAGTNKPAAASGKVPDLKAILHTRSSKTNNHPTHGAGQTGTGIQVGVHGLHGRHGGINKRTCQRQLWLCPKNSWNRVHYFLSKAILLFNNLFFATPTANVI